MQRINIQQLRWFSHVVRMEEDAPPRRVFDAEICESVRIEEALLSIDITNWRKRAKSRGAWKDMLRQSEIR